MNENLWPQKIHERCSSDWRLSNELSIAAVHFFAKVFEHTRCPNTAWFGIQKTSISLVVGGIWLASIKRHNPDKGIWLVVDRKLKTKCGLSFCVMKSTIHKDPQRLYWAYSESFEPLRTLADCSELWNSYASASQTIPKRSRNATKRDTLNKACGRTPLVSMWPAYSNPENCIYPDDVTETENLQEGATRRISINAFERNPKARKDCIRHYGPTCIVCGLTFGNTYGLIADGFIHVHHLEPLSIQRNNRPVDPIKHMVPVCPNCHAYLHLQDPPFSIEEAKQAFESMKRH